MRSSFLVAMVVVFILSFFLYVDIPIPQQYELWNVDTRKSTVVRGYFQSNRNMTGRWIGHTWIPPPPWRLYSPSELRPLWANKKVWWLGDSTARRGALTLYHVLNNTSVRENFLNRRRIIDVNKRRVTEPCPVFDNSTFGSPYICRPMPGSTNASEMAFVLSSLACAFDVQKFLRNEMNLSHSPRTNILEFDLIIIAIGIWDLVRELDCRGGGKIDRPTRITGLLQTCLEFTQQTGIPIVFRTSGYQAQTNEDEKRQHIQDALIMNSVAMDFVDSLQGQSGLTYIDWGGAILERSFGPERITGDLDAHYGVEPRLVLMQMLTNHLVERGVFKPSI
ncbi:hypothetical protein MHU86_8653 [Fragilaria crotonensis]|nr:hypothetical protein MHU86_8653 [Fragilaria crotonensis]